MLFLPKLQDWVKIVSNLQVLVFKLLRLVIQLRLFTSKHGLPLPWISIDEHSFVYQTLKIVFKARLAWTHLFSHDCMFNPLLRQVLWEYMCLHSYLIQWTLISLPLQFNSPFFQQEKCLKDFISFENLNCPLKHLFCHHLLQFPVIKVINHTVEGRLIDSNLK